jgi:hypothetical protein
MTKFKVSPSVRAAAIPTGTGFGAFGGLLRRCNEYKKVKGGVLRCAVFKEGRGQPKCDTRLKDGGRSPGLIRDRKCLKGKAPKAPKKAPAKKAARRAKKK